VLTAYLEPPAKSAVVPAFAPARNVRASDSVVDAQFCPSKVSTTAELICPMGTEPPAKRTREPMLTPARKARAWDSVATDHVPVDE
jgi:hypothetical protein